MRFHKSCMTAALAIFALSGVAHAQDQKAPKPDGDVVFQSKIEIETAVGQDGDVVAASAPNTFVFLSSEMSFDRKVVKGAPYSAEATTETIQTLSDGNRIVRKNSATVYRDSEGRTRREQTLGVIGQWTAAGDPPKTIFINDPVARVNYTLDPKTQTARSMRMMQLPQPGQTFERVVVPPGAGAVAPAPSPGVRVFEDGATRLPRREKPKVESLGRQTIEGVEAEGTRTTITIPAGQIGNERPIDIVTERWYSPELQVVVYSKKTDPMAGETTYKLTNINRSEPAHSLFEVPAGYTVKEMPGFNLQWRERRTTEERKAQQQ